MKVCFYGCFDEQYDRNWSIINSARLFARVELLNSKKGFFARSIELFFKALRSDFDALIVLYPGHLDVFTAKLACIIKGKPLLFDKFVSQMDSEIEYGNIGKNSFSAKWHLFLDKLGCMISDKVFLDTKEHVEFFEKELKIKADFAVIPIGANEEAFHPLKARHSKKFQALYYGITTPFHGFGVICEAAGILSKKSVNFVFVGASKKHFEPLRSKHGEMPNVQFLPPVSKKELNRLIAESSACLGVFGSTPKIQRVVPLKVIEGMACKKPVICGKGIALENSFKDRKEILFCEKNPVALAKAILELKNNSKLRNSMAVNAFAVFKKYHSAKALAKILEKEISGALKR